MNSNMLICEASSTTSWFIGTRSKMGVRYDSRNESKLIVQSAIFVFAKRMSISLGFASNSANFFEGIIFFLMSS